MLDLIGGNIIFEHRFGESVPVGLYFEKKCEYLNIVFENGDIDVFNLNIGNLQMLARLRA